MARGKLAKKISGDTLLFHFDLFWIRLAGAGNQPDVRYAKWL